MHIIKKYANRKLYDSTDKRYVKISEITGLIEAGEEVTIIDNSTGEDITADVISQQLGENLRRHLRGFPLKVMFGVLRKGKSGLVDFSQSYVSFLQGTLSTLTGERIGNFSGKSKSEDPGEKQIHLDEEDVARQIEMINEVIDLRLEEILNKKGFATQKQMDDISGQLDNLSSQLATYDKIFSQLIEKSLSPDSHQK